MLTNALRTLSVLLIAAGVFAASALGAERVALVIGNSAYKNATELPNPRNDASDIAGVLEKLGFEVILGIDQDKPGMDGKVREFAEKAQEAKVALFFYAGHGMQVNGKNYLIPIDAKLETTTALDFEVVDSDQIMSYMSSSERTGIVLLDACHDNPLSRSFRSKIKSRTGAVESNGLATRTGADPNLLIAFATAPGETALDGAGRNSPFTKALLKFLPTKNREFRSVLTLVKKDVQEQTSTGQIPWSHDNLTDDLYLNGESGGGVAGDPGAKPPEADPAAARVQAARNAWEAIKDLSKPAVFDTLANQYADTIYGEFARDRAAELRKAATSAPDFTANDGPTEEARKAWQEIKELTVPEVFEALAQQYPGTIYAQFAVKRAKDLRKRVAEVQPDDKKVVERSSARWFVVTGSFPKPQRAKANQRRSEVRNAGYEAVIVDSNDYDNLADGLLVVVIKATTREQAFSIKDRVAGQLGDAYVKEAF